MSEDQPGFGSERVGTAILRLVRTVILIDVILFAVTGLVCYINGWRTLHHLSDALLYAGLALAGLAYAASGTHLLTGRIERGVPQLAYKTLLKTGEPPALAYPVVFAGLIAILASIVLGLFA